MRIWISNLPSPSYDANEIVGATVSLLKDHVHEFVTRNNKIYYVTKSGHFGFWINPVTRLTRIYDINDDEAKEVYYNNTVEEN